MKIFTPAKGRLCAAVCAVSAVLTALSFYLAMTLDFDADIGHFARGSVFFTAFAALVVISFVYAVLSWRVSKKYVFSEPPRADLLYYFGGCLAALLSAAVFVIGLADGRLEVLTGSGTVTTLRAKSNFELVGLILTPFIAISYLMTLLGRKRESRLRAVITSAAALSLVFSLFATYFDFSIPLNSAIRNCTTIMESCLCLFLLSEARGTFPADEKRASYPFSVFASALASSVSLGLSAGMLLHRIITPLENDPTPGIYSCAMYFAVSLTALSRLISLTKCAAEKPEEKNTENENENGEAEATDGENSENNTDNTEDYSETE